MHASHFQRAIGAARVVRRHLIAAQLPHHAPGHVIVDRRFLAWPPHKTDNAETALRIEV